MTMKFPALGSPEQQRMQKRAAKRMQKVREAAWKEILSLQKATTLALSEYDRSMREGDYAAGGKNWDTFSRSFAQLRKAKNAFYGIEETVVASSDSFKNLIASRS